MLECVPLLDREMGNEGEEGKKPATPARQTKREGVQQLVQKEEIAIAASRKTTARQPPGKLTHMTTSTQKILSITIP